MLRTACALKRRPEGAAQTPKFGSAEGEVRLVQHVLSFDNSAKPLAKRRQTQISIRASSLLNGGWKEPPPPNPNSSECIQSNSIQT
jgi:hypothetical protein